MIKKYFFNKKILYLIFFSIGLYVVFTAGYELAIYQASKNEPYSIPHIKIDSNSNENTIPSYNCGEMHNQQCLP